MHGGADPGAGAQAGLLSRNHASAPVPDLSALQPECLFWVYLYVTIVSSIVLPACSLGLPLLLAAPRPAAALFRPDQALHCTVQPPPGGSSSAALAPLALPQRSPTSQSSPKRAEALCSILPVRCPSSWLPDALLPRPLLRRAGLSAPGYLHRQRPEQSGAPARA